MNCEIVLVILWALMLINLVLLFKNLKYQKFLQKREKHLEEMIHRSDEIITSLRELKRCTPS